MSVNEKAVYVPVPVEVAREIAGRFGKSMVVILAYDPAHQLTHTTTYGQSALEKERAADVGDRCTKLICGEGFEQKRTFEDYRFVDAGKRAEAIEAMTKAAKGGLHLCGSLLAVRTGASDELIRGVRDALQDAVAKGNAALASEPQKGPAHA